MAIASKGPTLVSSNGDPLVKLRLPIDKLKSATPLVWKSDQDIPLRQWIYGRELIRKFVTVTIAAGGTGKTLLSIAEMLSMVSGRNLLGSDPSSRLKVWFYNLEDPMEEMERRIFAAARFYGLTKEDIAEGLFVDTGRERPLTIAKQMRSGVEIQGPILNGLFHAIRSRNIDVLIVDPLISSHDISENDNAGIDQVVKEWCRLADLTGCAIHLVHHARKTFGAEAGVDDARGASALLAAARIGRVLNLMTKEEATKAGLPSNRSHFRMSHGKSSLSKPLDEQNWFEIKSVHLNNGPGGSIGDSIGVVSPWTWRTTSGTVDASQVLTIKEALAGGEWRESSQAPGWVGVPIAEALGLSLSDDAKQVKAIIKTMVDDGHLLIVEGLDASRRKRLFITPAPPA